MADSTEPLLGTNTPAFCEFRTPDLTALLMHSCSANFDICFSLENMFNFFCFVAIL